MTQERQVVTHNKNRDCQGHQDESQPEAPVPVRSRPIRRVNMTGGIVLRPFISVIAFAFVHVISEALSQPKAKLPPVENGSARAPV
jgi:hypothetical protein